jgi:hypothetical protein
MQSNGIISNDKFSAGQKNTQKSYVLTEKKVEN